VFEILSARSDTVGGVTDVATAGRSSGTDRRATAPPQGARRSRTGPAGRSLRSPLHCSRCAI